MTTGRLLSAKEQSLGQIEVSTKSFSPVTISNGATQYTQTPVTYALLPTEFQEVEYISANNNYEYIQTNQTVTSDLMADGKFAYTVALSSGWQMAFGIWSNFVIGADGINSVQLNCAGNTSSKIALTANTINTFQMGSKYGSMINGVRLSTSTSTNTVNNRHLCIFGAPDASAGSDAPYTWTYHYSQTKWYHLRFYSGNGDFDTAILTHEYIPCYNKVATTAYKCTTQVQAAANSPGVYDIVENKFYINSGSGTIGLGPDVTKYHAVFNINKFGNWNVLQDSTTKIIKAKKLSLSTEV